MVFKGMFLTDALLSLLYPQPCQICGGSVERHRFGVACEKCWKKTQPCTNRCVIGWYEGALRETVLLLKRQPVLPQHLVALIEEVSNSFAGVTRVVPVPLHKDRLRSRGFNQAAIIAREMSRALRVPLDEVSLVRVTTSEKHRTGLDAKGRRDSVARAFAVPHPRLVNGEDILLVDDVLTTGATVEACEAALTDSGARSVVVFALAQARH